MVVVEVGRNGNGVVVVAKKAGNREQKLGPNQGNLNFPSWQPTTS
jgi:hypothetical protein